MNWLVPNFVTTDPLLRTLRRRRRQRLAAQRKARLVVEQLEDKLPPGSIVAVAGAVPETLPSPSTPGAAAAVSSPTPASQPIGASFEEAAPERPSDSIPVQTARRPTARPNLPKSPTWTRAIRPPEAATRSPARWPATRWARAPSPIRLRTPFPSRKEQQGMAPPPLSPGATASPRRQATAGPGR